VDSRGPPRAARIALHKPVGVSIGARDYYNIGKTVEWQTRQGEDSRLVSVYHLATIQSTGLPLILPDKFAMVGTERAAVMKLDPIFHRSFQKVRRS